MNNVNSFITDVINSQQDSFSIPVENIVIDGVDLIATVQAPS